MKNWRPLFPLPPRKRSPMLTSLFLAFLLQVAPESVLPVGVYNPKGDAAVAERLIAAGEIYARAGEYLIGEGNPALAESLSVDYTALPALAPDEELVLVRAHRHDPQASLPDGLRLLWRSEGFSLGAAPSHAVVAAVRKHASCHNSVQLITRQPLVPVLPRTFGRQAAVSADPRIQAMVAQVDKANIEAVVTHLSTSYYSRRHFTSGEVQAQNWLRSQFDSYGGLTTSLHNYDSGADNVVAELPGQGDPSKVVIVGSHYDSVNWNSTSQPAPGADDNASGTAGVHEIARVLSQYPFEYTIRFINFSGEELGLYGSEAYAGDMQSQGQDIVAMINLDMTSYRRPQDPYRVYIVEDDTSAALNAFLADVYAAYLPGFGVWSGTLLGGTSDHRPFNNHGFPACFPFEDFYDSPYLHTADDVIGTSATDFQLAAYITQGALAALAELARPLGITMSHTPLVDTTDEGGPYPVTATVQSLIGSNVTGAELHWRVGGSASFSSVAMTAGPGANEWSASIPGQISPAQVEYYLTAADDQGSTAWLPSGFGAGEETYSFWVAEIQEIYFADFEGSSDAGWTHAMVSTQDDWQRSSPGPNAGSAGDPLSSYSGSKHWGNDLGPNGWDGKYKSNVNNYLESPPIDCSGATNVHLQFQRSLTVEEGKYDKATIKVNGTQVWVNPQNGHTADSGWTPVTLDISSHADGNASVEVRFQLQSDAGLEFGGWNIDDFRLVSIGPVSGSDAMLLTGPVSAAPGSSLAFDLSQGPANGSSWLLYSLSATGSAIFGHSFDLGSPWYIADGPVGLDASGAAVLAGIVPASVPNGLTVYLEAGASGAGSIFDSNLLTLTIL